MNKCSDPSVLTGEGFRSLLVAGAHRVIAFREELNRINVFPVPDKDTGTNLAATMGAVAEGLSKPMPSLSAVGASAASCALGGAQGNSGVIVAEFFRGMREELEDSVHLTMDRFVAALRRASQRARESLAQPKDGTILTVINDVAEHLTQRVAALPGFTELLDEGLAVAKRSLRETTERLAVLRKAGVVDAGALGFVHFLEGIRDFFHHGGHEVAFEQTAPTAEQIVPDPQEIPTHITFRYCTEAVIRGRSIPRKQILAELSQLGDSVVVAGDACEIHAHVHSNAPAYVLETLARHGELVHQKIDDMLEEVSLDRPLSVSLEREGIALVTDTVCDLPLKLLAERSVHMVPAQIAFGDESLLDRVDITPTQFYRRLAASQELPKTSQPRPSDFQKLYRHLAMHHEAVLSVHVSAGLSGTWQAAKRAADEVSREAGIPIHVIDSGSASVAEGLVVWAVAQCVSAGLDPEACIRIADALCSNVFVYVYVPTVDYFVRGGRLSPLQGRIARWLRFQPILTTKDGQLLSDGKPIGKRAAQRTLIRRVLHAAKSMERPAFAIGHSDAPDLARRLEVILTQAYPGARVWTTDTTPAIGCHAGPGGAAIAVVDEGDLQQQIDEAVA